MRGFKTASETEDELQMSTSRSSNSKTLSYGGSTITSRLLDSDNSSHDHDDHDDHEQTQDTDLETATNSSDEFDWSAEEEASSSKHVLELQQKARRGRRIWNMFMRLARPIRTSIIGLLGAAIFIAPLLIVQFRFPDTVVYNHVFAWSLWLSVTWAAGCVTYTIVDFFPSIIIRAVMLFHGRVEILQSQLELLSAVAAWVKLALDITWMWIALSIIRVAFNPPGSYWVIINRVMQAFFSAGLILLVEKLFLRFVAIRFHKRGLADRLAENRLGLKALERLSDSVPTLLKNSPYSPRKNKGYKNPVDSFKRSEDFFSKKGVQRRDFGSDPQQTASDSVDTSAGVDEIPSRRIHRKQRKYVEKTRKEKRHRILASVIIDQLGDAIEQVAMKDSKLNKGGEIGGLHSARRLAKQLFTTLNVLHPGRHHLLVEDFYPYFRSKVDAIAAFALFDKDNNGDLTKKEMREAVQRIYKERKALTASLKDIDSVVAKLDAVLVAVALMFITFLCILIFDRQDTITSLVPLATIILGFSFIFGHSAQTLFESLIFIFSTHVFDVGDLVMIDDSPMFVQEFGLFSTTFKRVDGQEIIAPNSLLASSKLVHNLRRSNSMSETTTLMISYDTSLEVVEQLKSRLQAYVSDNSREWSNVSLNIDKMDFQNAIYLTIAMEHRSNWQDWGGRWTRRTLFMRNLKTILEELEVSYSMPIQPVLLPKYSPFTTSFPSGRHPEENSSPSARRDAQFHGNAGHFRNEGFILPVSSS